MKRTRLIQLTMLLGIGSASLPPLHAQNGWQLQMNGVPVDKNLYAVDALSTLQVWTCGEDGVVLLTTDGGVVWVSANPAGTISTTEQLVVIETFNAQQAWVGSASGRIYHTTDAGVTWTTQADSGAVTGPVAFIKRVLLTRLFAVGSALNASSQLAVLYTTNSGSSWTNVDTSLTGGSVPHAAADFADASNGWLWSTTHGLQRSTDAGVTWNSVVLSGLDSVRDITFLSSSLGLILDPGGGIWRTTNNGSSWEQTSVPLVPLLNSVGFAPNSPYRFAVGEGGTILASPDSGAGWASQTSNVTTGLNGVSFGSTTTGWIVGDQGTILKTTSAGVLPDESAWEVQSHQVPSDYNFKLVKALSSRECLILGVSSSGSVMIARTADAGGSWDYVSSDQGITESELVAYQIVTRDTAYLGTSDGRVLKTDDGGLKWTTVFQAPSEVSAVQFIHFFDPLNGVAIGDAASSSVPIGVFSTVDGGITWANQNTSFLGAHTFPDAVGFWSPLEGLLVVLPDDEWYYTSDGGQTWTSYPKHPAITYYHFLSDGSVLGIGIEAPRISNAIYKTADRGVSWEYKTSDGTQVEFDNFSSVGAFVWALHGPPDPYTGYMRMKHSTDAGETWSIQPVPTTEILTGVSFASPDSGWAITSSTVLFTETGGLTYVRPSITNRVPLDFELRQNYPNPFNPSTRILFILARPARVSLVIFDILGQQVALLADGVRDSGTHEIVWDAQDIPGGVYFSRLNANGHLMTRKMVLVK